jgi:hypothetical protein
VAGCVARYSPQTSTKVREQSMLFFVNIASTFGTEIILFHIYKTTF